MDAASLLCSKGLMALYMCDFETHIALFLQDIWKFINTLLYLIQTSQFSWTKCTEMCIASILFVIVYHEGLNCRPVTYLGCDWIVENNYFTEEREISESLCSCGLFIFKNCTKRSYCSARGFTPRPGFRGTSSVALDLRNLVMWTAPEAESWSRW